ncbi:hypothetical protein TI04_03395 [Achromatium sp. WMS2]|nr:hypothetical protein TI04_03395 [Achromatium sp. WMS2]
MPKSDLKTDQQSDLKRTFLRYLPGRIDGIEDDWLAITGRGWNLGKLKDLTQRVQDLATVAHKFNASKIYESMHSLARYLQALLDRQKYPSSLEIEQVGRLISHLKATSQNNEIPNEDFYLEITGKNYPIFYLRGKTDLAPELKAALDPLDCSLLRFTQLTDLVDKANKVSPAALIVDSEMLPQVTKFLADTTIFPKNVAPVLLVFSSSSDMEVRLLALRSGARAFFAAPIDVKKVAERVHILLTPVQEPPHKVLIMDDDPPQAEFAAAILRKGGLEVCKVTEHPKLLETIEDFKPDLVLMDMYMPDVNGIELTRIIREQTNMSSLPVVFISGEQDADKQLDAISIGGDDFITKPFHPRHLMTIVTNRIIRARAITNSPQNGLESKPLAGGLVTKQELLKRVNQILANGQDGFAHGLIYLQINDLDNIKDDIGDKNSATMLETIGDMILTALRPSDLCSNTEEYQFTVLATRSNRQDLIKLGNELISIIANWNLPFAGVKYKLSVNSGFCNIEPAPYDVATLEQMATEACKQSQIEGGNCLIIQTSSKGAKSAIDLTTISQQDALALIQRTLSYNHIQVNLQRFVNPWEHQTNFCQIDWHLVIPEVGSLKAYKVLNSIKQSVGLGRDIDCRLMFNVLNIMSDYRQTGDQIRLLVRQTNETLASLEAINWLKDQLQQRLLSGSGLIIEFGLMDIIQDVKQARAIHEKLAAMDIGMCFDQYGANLEASYKVLRYLKPEYVRISEQLLQAKAEDIASILQQIHEAGAKAILPYTKKPHLIASDWQTGTDFIQENAL